jgi:predicted GTPase
VPPINVALVGMTGVGKSTLVNILKLEGSLAVDAQVNNDTDPCTLEATRYEVVEAGTTYHIWDTRGLNEASKKGFIKRCFPSSWTTPEADRQLENLLSGEPKIDVVLFCIRIDKIRTLEHWEMHTKIDIPPNMKVAVVVTQMEGDIGSSQWKETCKDTAKLTTKGVILDTDLMEGVPKFKNLQEQDAKDCRVNILDLISRCQSRGC